jgi:hypothetical protein
LGHLKEALAWLEKAFAMGNAKAIKLRALEDPDLSPLWERIGEI